MTTSTTHGVSPEIGTDWRDDAECRDSVDPELWFPVTTRGRSGEDRYNSTARPALDVCAICPVATDCLLFALDIEGGFGVDNREGVWGGTTPYERARLAKGLRS